MTYPVSPGFKGGSTSEEAALAIAPRAMTLRGQVLEALEESDGLTPDECADRLRVSILSIRPRFSELRRTGLIIETGTRRVNASGHKAAVYAARA